MIINCRIKYHAASSCFVQTVTFWFDYVNVLIIDTLGKDTIYIGKYYGMTSLYDIKPQTNKGLDIYFINSFYYTKQLKVYL